MLCPGAGAEVPPGGPSRVGDGEQAAAVGHGLRNGALDSAVPGARRRAAIAWASPQRQMVPSGPPVASLRPSRLVDSHSALPECPTNVRVTSRLVYVDRTRAPPFQLPATVKRPSGVKARTIRDAGGSREPSEAPVCGRVDDLDAGVVVAIGAREGYRAAAGIQRHLVDEVQALEVTARRRGGPFAGFTSAHRLGPAPACMRMTAPAVGVGVALAVARGCCRHRTAGTSRGSRP